MYRIVIQNTMPETTTNGSNAEKHVAIGNDIGERFVEFGFITDGNYNKVPMPYITTAGHQTKCYISGHKELILINGSTLYNNRPCTVSILYTKTTD